MKSSPTEGAGVSGSVFGRSSHVVIAGFTTLIGVGSLNCDRRVCV